MLKQRILTALLLAPLVIWGIFVLTEPVFNLALAAVMGLAAWEWAQLAGWRQPLYRAGYTLLIVILMYAILLGIEQQSFMQALFAIVLLWWVIKLIHLFSYRHRALVMEVHTFTALLSGLPVLLGTYFAVVLLRNTPEYGPAHIMMLMILVWGADTAAYFVGRRLGKNKLLVSVSPGKSWEGVWGALVASVLLSLLGGIYFSMVDSQLLLFLLVGLLTVVFSIVGDLNESYYKRRVGLKDSGKILPGHGGILDRIDSLTAAAPVYYVGLVMIGQ